MRLLLQSPEACRYVADQDAENPDVPNGSTEEVADGEEMNMATTRKTRRKRWVRKGAEPAAAHHSSSSPPFKEGEGD